MLSIAKKSKNATGSTAFGYLLKEMVLILCFLYLFVFNRTSLNFISPPVVNITAGLVTFLGLLWFVRGQAASTPLGRSLAVFMGAYLLASFFSIDPRRSVEEFGWLLLIIFFFALTADLVAQRWPAELIIKTLLITWSVLLAFIWIAPLNWYMEWLKAFPGRWFPEVIYRPSMPNTIAMALNTFIMLLIARWFYTRSLVGRVMLGIVTAAALLLLYLTSSRSGWMGSAAGMACLVVWVGLKQRAVLLSLWGWLKARPLLLAGGGVLLAGVLVGVGWLLYRQTIHPTHGPLLISRNQFWGPAITTFLRYPILGQGPNTMSRSLIEAQTLSPGAIFVHAHSTPLNLLAETGLVGLLCGLGLGAGMVLALRRRWQEAQGSDLAVVMGASASLAAYAVQGLFDSFQTEPIGLWLLAIVLGAALGAAPEPLPKRAARPKRAMQVSGLFSNLVISSGRVANVQSTPRPWWVLALAAGAWVNIWLAQPLHQGVEAMNNSRPAEAVAFLEQAVARDPYSVIAWQQLGVARAVQAQDEAGYRQAIQALERAAEMDPIWGFNFGNLGALYRAAGDAQTARRLLEHAITLADVPVFHLNLAIIAEQQGDLETARRQYDLALVEYDSLWESDFWEQSPLRQEVRAAHQHPVGLSAEEIAQLEQSLEANPSYVDLYLPLAESYLNKGQIEAAAGLLQQARHATVLSGSKQATFNRLSLRVAEAQGQTAEAERYRQELMANCLMQGFTGPAESPTQQYALFAFRKPSMFIEMVPQLERMPCP